MKPLSQISPHCQALAESLFEALGQMTGEFILVAIVSAISGVVVYIVVAEVLVWPWVEAQLEARRAMKEGKRG